MQVCTSLQTDNHARTPPLFFSRPDALPAAQPTVSKHRRHCNYKVTTIDGNSDLATEKDSSPGYWKSKIFGSHYSMISHRSSCCILVVYPFSQLSDASTQMKCKTRIETQNVIEEYIHKISWHINKLSQQLPKQCRTQMTRSSATADGLRDMMCHNIYCTSIESCGKIKKLTESWSEMLLPAGMHRCTYCLNALMHAQTDRQPKNIMPPGLSTGWANAQNYLSSLLHTNVHRHTTVKLWQ